MSLESRAAPTVFRLLKRVYTGDYPDEVNMGSVSTDYAGPKTHIHVYFLADYLGVDELRIVAAQRFHEIQSKMEGSEKDFMEVVKLVFEDMVSRQDLLRKQVVDIALENHDHMRMEEEYDDLLFEADGLAAALVLELPVTTYAAHDDLDDEM